MKIKYEEFYYNADKKNYLAETYWNLFDKNRKEAEKKFDGHMFCPQCAKAPLTVVKGNERRYFKVIKTEMEMHDVDCPYKYNRASRKETKKFYKDLDKADIRNRLVSCLNKMLKSNFDKINSNSSNSQEKIKNKNNFLLISCESNIKKYLPHKNFNSKNLEETMDIQKIYYGTCALYVCKYIPEGETQIKKYYLKILNKSNKKQICELEISPYIYAFFNGELDGIPDNKNDASNYCVCFSGILRKDKGFLKCKLEDSRLLVLEKE